MSLMRHPLLVLLLLVIGWWYLGSMINNFEDSMRQSFSWMLP